MSGRDVIQLAGSILEVLSERLYRVELANGHRMLGYRGRRDAGRKPGFRPGERVILEVSPYDFSAGRIRGTAEEPSLGTG